MGEITPYLTKTQGLEILYVGMGVGVLLIIVEILNRRGHLTPEVARKSIHIIAGMLLAMLPLFMTRPQVFLTNMAFLAGVLVLTGWLKIFKAVHAVERWTIGEFLYPFSGALLALVYDDIRIYMLGVIILAFSDGLAGLLGRRYGGKGYRVWGGTKSLLGNAVFFGATLFVLASFVSIVVPNPSGIDWIIATAGALLLTCVEALFGGGFDNLAVPLAASLIAYLLLAV